MKVTKTQLKQIIKEEVKTLLNEAHWDHPAMVRAGEIEDEIGAERLDRIRSAIANYKEDSLPPEDKIYADELLALQDEPERDKEFGTALDDFMNTLHSDEDERDPEEKIQALLDDWDMVP